MINLSETGGFKSVEDIKALREKFSKAKEKSFASMQQSLNLYIGSHGAYEEFEHWLNAFEKMATHVYQLDRLIAHREHEEAHKNDPPAGLSKEQMN